MIRNTSARTGALVAFVLAEGVAAHPRPTRSLDQVRLIGATELLPDEAAYDRGKALLAVDDIVGALSAFRQALSADPRSLDAMNGLGVCYDRIGRSDLARTYYVAGLAIDPTSPSLNNNLGYSLYLSGDYAAAVGPLRVAASSTDRDAAAAAGTTLAKLVAAARTSPDDATVAAEAGPRIELTNDGEQRLTFVAAAVTAPALGDVAEATVVAAAWTPADDKALVARIDAEEAAERTAADESVETRRPTAVPRPEAAVLAVELQPQRTVAMPVPQIQRRAIEVRSVPGLVLAQATSSTTSPRRYRSATTSLAIATSGGPQPRVIVDFDSDDAELNAFAMRMATHDPAATTLPEDRGRIAARFRT